jgi:ketosteroid isomerase-like protein
VFDSKLVKRLAFSPVNRRLFCLLGSLALFATGCFRAARLDPGLEADALLRTDQAFAAQALKTDAADAFREFLAPEGVQLPPVGAPVLGREAVAARMRTELILSWKPMHAEVAQSSDLGWSWGTYEVHARENPGGPALAVGKYVNIWRRQPDGSWKVIADIGNQAPPASSSAAQPPVQTPVSPPAPAVGPPPRK